MNARELSEEEKQSMLKLRKGKSECLEAVLRTPQNKQQIKAAV